MPKRSLLTVAAFVAAIVATNGCGSSAKNKIIPAQGKIAFEDGTSLPPGTQLIFNPTEGGTGAAKGVTDASGAFKLKHVSGKDGAEVGTYSVVLAGPESNVGNFFELVPKQYTDGAGALTAEIKEGMGAIELKIIR